MASRIDHSSVRRLQAPAHGPEFCHRSVAKPEAQARPFETAGHLIRQADVAARLRH